MSTLEVDRRADIVVRWNHGGGYPHKTPAMITGSDNDYGSITFKKSYLRNLTLLIEEAEERCRFARKILDGIYESGGPKDIAIARGRLEANSIVLHHLRYECDRVDRELKLQQSV